MNLRLHSGAHRFQSAPGAEAGGINKLTRALPFADQFQSAPGAEAGGIYTTDSYRRAIERFQSAPGAEAGGILLKQWAKFQLCQVSIRPRR